MINDVPGRNQVAPGFEPADLLTAQAFPHAVGAFKVRETHTSWVILTGPYAYKIKKPLELDFIDTSTLEKRKHYCEEELRLNQRFAPEIYVDVVPIVRSEGRLSIGGSGVPVEYAVRMQQFSARDELQLLIEHDEVCVGDITELAERLAHYHMNAPIAAAGEPDELTQSMYLAVLGNVSDLIARLDTAAAAGVQRLAGWTHHQAHTLEGAFQLREQSSHIRECHGDLHVANIVRWRDHLMPYDCLEFDPKLRWIDVMNDLAFLAMDLAGHYRTDLAFALLSRYLEVTGDYEGVRVLRFYAVYRALVRAKVDVLSARQTPQRAPEYFERLNKRIATAERWTRPGNVALILMHGPSGSGKSWLSEQLVPAIHAIRVRSDLERKRLARMDPESHAAAPVGQGIYRSEVTHRTYARLAECAEICLRAGFNVIVDAASLDLVDRELFRTLATRLSIPYVIASCQADPITLAAHVLGRSRDRKDASDADLAVLDAQLRTIQSFSPVESAHVLTVDTSEANVVEATAAAIKTRTGILVPAQSEPNPEHRGSSITSTVSGEGP